MQKNKHLFIGVVVAAVVVGAWLRVWNLPTHLILFGDAGHDLLTAHAALAENELPLLGIESSVPRFRQGPVTIWMLMGLQLLVGTNTFAITLAFAVISLLAVITWYEVLVTRTNEFTAAITTWLLAVSPLAVAQARMPYHTSPIVAAMVLFLWAQVRFAEKKRGGLFFGFLSWAMLFQFELAVAPLILVTVLIWYRDHKPKNGVMFRNQVAIAGSSLGLGLFPQILHDVTHGFEHLGGFAVWVMYRLVSFTGVTSGPSLFSLDRWLTTFQAFGMYYSRSLTVDFWPYAVLGLSFLGLSYFHLTKKLLQKGEVTHLAKVVWLSFSILALAYVIHGSPSEAYFPPFLVLIPSLIGFGLNALQPKARLMVFGLFILGGLVSSYQIYAQNFFVDTSNRFSYGPSWRQQQQVVSYIAEESENSFQLTTTHPAGKFEKYFDNLKWAHLSLGFEPVAVPTRVFVVETTQELDSYPNMKKRSFSTMHVYEIQ